MVIMTDLIERNAAYGAIGFERCGRSCADCPTKCTWYYTVRNIPAANCLIPCSEQLPDKDGNYLVLQRDRFEILEYRTELKQFGYTYEDEEELGHPYTEWAEMQNVTHWMPLPNKPEDLNNG